MIACLELVRVVEHMHALAGTGSFVFGTQEVTVSTSAFNVNAVAAMDADADGWVDVVYVAQPLAKLTCFLRTFTRNSACCAPPRLYLHPVCFSV